MKPAEGGYDLGHGCSAIRVTHYDLKLRYRVRSNWLEGRACLDIRIERKTKRVALDLVGLQVTRVRLEGARLRRYRHTEGRLTLRLDSPAARGTRLRLVIHYRGRPRPVRTRWGPVGWDQLDDGAIVASQPTGAPSWFPCDDRPGSKATYRTRIRVPNAYRVLAHGRLTGRSVGRRTTRWTFVEDHPTPTYLATVQIGRYAELSLASRRVPQSVLAPADLTTAARRRLARQPAMMATFTDLFGPYPFDGYTVVFTAEPLDLPIEAQGIAVFGANHLHDAATQRLVPHELAHQWFGNSVSVASWQHIWLNEGFACYAEWLWSEACGGPSAATLARRWHTRLAGQRQDLVLADPGPGNLFDDRVYKRGALALHALRGGLGDRVWVGMVRRWTRENRDATVTTDDFCAHAHRAARSAHGRAHAGRVDRLLDAWLLAAPLPPLPRR